MIKLDNNLNFSTGDARYLKLDCSNDPLTGLLDLSVGAAVTGYGTYSYPTGVKTSSLFIRPNINKDTTDIQIAQVGLYEYDDDLEIDIYTPLNIYWDTSESKLRIDGGGLWVGTGLTRMFFNLASVSFRAGADNGAWSVQGTYSAAFGYDCTANDSATFAAGNGSDATGDTSFAVGTGAMASGDYSASIGFGSISSGEGAVSFASSTASGDYSLATGDSTASGDYSLSAGGATASGIYSFAQGEGVISAAYANTALGRFNVGGGTAGSWVATDPLFEIGNGTANDARANAFQVLKNGNTTISGTALINTTLTLATGSITDSTGNISFSNENLSTTGTFGAGDTTIDGKVIIDITDTEALLVRKNADAGDVFAVDTNTKNVSIPAGSKFTANMDTGVTYLVSVTGTATPANVVNYTYVPVSLQPVIDGEGTSGNVLVYALGGQISHIYDCTKASGTYDGSGIGLNFSVFMFDTVTGTTTGTLGATGVYMIAQNSSPIYSGTGAVTMNARGAYISAQNTNTFYKDGGTIVENTTGISILSATTEGYDDDINDTYYGGARTGTITGIDLTSKLDIENMFGSDYRPTHYGVKSTIQIEDNSGYSYTDFTAYAFYARFYTASSVAPANVWGFYNSITAAQGGKNLLGLDSVKTYFGTGSDSYIEFDGDSLNIVGNAVTATDDINLTSQYVYLLDGTILQVNSAGDDKNLIIKHDDTNGYVNCSSGDIDIYTPAGKTIELQTVVYDDIRVSGTSVKPGATAPELGQFLAAGGINTYLFDGASRTEEAHFQIQMPHGYKLGTVVYPHVHWTPTSASTGTVMWSLEYSWAKIYATFPVATTVTATAVAATGTAWVHQYSEFASFSGSNIDTVSSMIMCRLFRNPANDTYPDDVALCEVDFHYAIDTIGSRTEIAK